MAKKKIEKEVVEEPQVEETVVAEAPKPEPKPEPIVVEEAPKKDTWEIKDTVYYLKGGAKPLTRSIRAANIYYFVEEQGFERELKYCKNQRTVFVDEMKGDQRLEHIIFRNGALFVPKNEQMLQKLLSLYHPDKDKLYYEWKPVAVAENQLDWLEFEVEALTIAKSMDIDIA